MKSIEERRVDETQKYVRAYSMQPNYRMKNRRFEDAVRDLKNLPSRGAYLDVSCGRGDMLDAAGKLGFSPVLGTEIVPELIDGDRVVWGQAHAIPFADKSFDVVTLFDVIEHLIPGDDEAVCREMTRVARKHILLTANNKSSFNKAGDDLHINKRLYTEWNKLFRRWFAPAKVTWIKGPRRYVSEAWRIDL